MRKVPGGPYRGLLLTGAALLLGCDRSPTSSEKVPIPSFSIVPGSGAWSTRAPMPTARFASAAGVINGVLYVVGGTDAVPPPDEGSAASHTANEAYDPVTDSWAAKAPFPEGPGGVVYAGAGVIAGKLYIVGGVFSNDALQPRNTLEVYDPVADVWTSKTPMPTAREQIAVGVISGKLYVVGGAGGGGQCCIPHSELEVYDPSSDTWTSKAPMPTARSAPA